MPGFAELPARIAAFAQAHARCAFVLLDAFGWAFVQRHSEHPFLARLEIDPLAAQFPSTTTAHLTTLYTGQPVAQHGLYEWRVFEPRVGTVIRPIRFAAARDEDPPLTQDPHDVLPAMSFFADLGVPVTVLHPRAIAHTAYGSVAHAGATVIGFDTIEEGVALLGAHPGLTYLYWDRIDAVGHKHGPSSDAFRHTSLRALDALTAFAGPLLVTADHGQIDVTVTDDLQELWPELPGHLTQHPAGSARDLFLHVDDPELVVAALAERLEGRAEVRLAAELFPDAGPRLRERLADVCVLPAPGRMVGLGTLPSLEEHFKGHHGGLTPSESETWVGSQA